MLLLTFVFALINRSVSQPKGSWNNDVDIQVDEGILRGGTWIPDGASSVKSTQFRGVPFAEPPIAHRRFRPPVPIGKWSGVRDAKSFAATCIQVESGFLIVEPRSEDCLYLNVYVPRDLSQTSNLSLPVMVWIHGGGLTIGSGSSYVPEQMIDEGDVIVVTINYRLAVFGFLSSGNSVLPGNIGFLDQQLALNWVNKNIYKFGGDPNHVTIFGESAGSWSVSLHTFSYTSQGLFKRAIAQSGHVAQLIGVQLEAEENFEKTIQRNNCTKRDQLESVECLRQLDAQTLLFSVSDIAFMATIDGIFLNETLDEMYARGPLPGIEVMTGVVEYEGWVFVDYVPNLITIFESTVKATSGEQAFKSFLSSFRPNFYSERLMSAVLSMYTPYDDLESVERWLTQLVIALGDQSFIAPTEAYMESANKVGIEPLYFYFSLKPSLSYSTTPDYIGAVHGDELQFLFDFAPLPTQEERDMKRRMIQIWTDFAKTGKPTVLPGETWQPWTKYDQSYLDLETNFSSDSLKKGVAPKRVDFWNVVFPELLKAEEPCEQPLPDPVVEVSGGHLRGRRIEQLGHIREEFLGIPYAAPPVGQLRFRATEPHEGWTGVRDAGYFRSRCMQLEYDIPAELDTTLRSEEMKKRARQISEDCLFLNVFVPRGVNHTKQSPVPVMLFIHGGGFYVGDSMAPDGSILAPYGDVIVVTIAYRLGVFGFFSTGDSAASGNWGLMDQRQAIKWVHQNIHSFGGDNSKITIFGESAGGASVTYQMLNAESRKYFRRAITISGTALAPWALGTETTRVASLALATKLGCTGTSASVVECLRTKNASDLNDKEAPSQDPVPYLPVLDGDFVTDDPQVLSLAGATKEIDLITTVNSVEALGPIDMVLGGFGINITGMITQQQIEMVLRALIYQSKNIPSELWQAMIRIHFGTESMTVEEFIRIAVPLVSDREFNAGAIQWIQNHVQNGGKAYMYVFSQTPTYPAYGNRQLVPGAGHADDLRCLFGYALDPNAPWTFTNQERLSSEVLMSAVTNFAKYGDPSSTAHKFEAYTLENKDYVEIGDDTGSKRDFRPRARAMWMNVVRPVTPVPCPSSTSGSHQSGNVHGEL